MACSDHQWRVFQFMRKAGQAVPSEPSIPNEHTRRLRALLILEEALETVNALGFSVDGVDADNLQLREVAEPDLIEIADGCADLSVVTQGTLLACGIEDAALFAEVDASNLRKFSDGGYERDDGKWVKPADWKPPNIQYVLDNQ